MCQPTVRGTCGQYGWCETRQSGNRCHCPPGKMGIKCSRPCQDVFKSCKKWLEEDRCYWARNTTSFFMDNCASSCEECKGDGKVLKLALPPMLEPLSWLVGKWVARTSSGQRFPTTLTGPYEEILDVQISEVPAFDRPGINISIFAKSLDNWETHSELGFMTGKPFNEDNGFLREAGPGEDLVAIELVSNTGLMTIEEGIIRGQSIVIESKYRQSMFGIADAFQEAKRKFTLISPGSLEERTIFKDKYGVEKKWLKRYRLVHDYLGEIIDSKEQRK
ncbi:unnamed protein product, partial [Mesorhabditis spiculigera]